jgi:hypothetical protein
MAKEKKSIWQLPTQHKIINTSYLKFGQNTLQSEHSLIISFKPYLYYNEVRATLVSFKIPKYVFCSLKRTSLIQIWPQCE